MTKAGLDPAAVDACSADASDQGAVNGSIKLADDAGITETPTLIVNGHLLPMASIPYESLKKIIEFQAALDGVSTGASATPARTPLPLNLPSSKPATK